MKSEEDKILILAALGLGAFFLMSRGAMAQAGPVLNGGRAQRIFAASNRTPSQPGQSAAGIYDPGVAIAGIFGNLAGKLFGSGAGGTAPNSFPATAVGPQFPTSYGDPLPGLTPTGYTSSTDGVAANPAPGQGAPYDYYANANLGGV